MENIKTLLDQNYTPPLIASLLDTTVERVIAEMGKLTLVGWGEARLYGFIIARKPVSEARWSDRFEVVLIKNRQLHDCGYVTMVQKRDGDYVVQYAIPSKAPSPRRLWFTAPPETY